MPINETKNENMYEEWIKQHYPDYESSYGHCHEAARQMKAAFPELTVVLGFVETGSWGRRDHVWLTAQDGSIVDPTGKQFLAIFEYIPWTPDVEVDVGPCANCGGPIMRKFKRLEDASRETICSDACHEDYARYLMSGI